MEDPPKDDFLAKEGEKDTSTSTNDTTEFGTSPTSWKRVSAVDNKRRSMLFKSNSDASIERNRKKNPDINDTQSLIASEISTLSITEAVEKLKQDQEGLDKLISQSSATTDPVEPVNEEIERKNLRESQERELEERQRRMRLEVINEILTTEKQYVKDLDITVRIFLDPLRKLDILSVDEIQVLFSNIETILKVNREIEANFQAALAAVGDPSQLQIGDIFLKTVEYLKMYNIYSNNYENSLNHYVRLTKTKPDFVKFLKESELNPECRGISFTGYLIKPVQKICKYPLLIKELLKNTPQSNPDYPNIENALKKTHAVAEYVNERKRAAENAQKLLEVQDKIVDMKDFQLISPSRSYVREGMLGKVNNHGKLQERYCFLFNDVLVYTAPQLLRKNYQFKGYILLDKVILSDANDTKYPNAFALSILDKKKKFIFNFSTPEEKASWMSDISKQVDSVLQKLQGTIERKAKTLTIRYHSTPRLGELSDDSKRSSKIQESPEQFLVYSVKIKSPDVELTTRLSLSVTVNDFTKKIAKKIPGNVDDFSLYFDGEKLDSEKKFSEYTSLVAKVLHNQQSSEETVLQFRP